MAKPKSFLVNVFFMLVIVIIMLIFLEIIIRIFFPQNLNYTKFDSTLMYKHIPNFEVRYSRQEFSNVIKFNSKGLRDHEYGYDKPKETFRILVLGSSFTQALQVNIDETYENLLENKLNKAKKYEVINTAVGGHGTAQELFYLRREGLKYKPDLILLDFSMRDIRENALSPLVSVENGKIVEKIPVKASLPKRSLLFCSRYLHLCSLAQTAILEGLRNKDNQQSNFVDIFQKDSTPEFESALEKTFLLIKEIKNVADANGIPLVMFVIPKRDQVDDAKYKEFIKNNNLEQSKLERDKFQKLAVKFAKQNNIMVFDMLQYFRQKNVNNTFYFNIDGHWNSKGHELASELLHDYLINNKLLG